MVDAPVAPVVIGKTEDGFEKVGIVGATVVGLVVIAENSLVVIGATGGLTPRLPIWVDPNGIPVRGSPPGAVGDVDVGVDDEARLPEPEPHIPDNPDVSGIPDVVDIADVDESPDDIDVPDIDVPEIDIPGTDVPDICVPDVAPVAGGAAPTTIPPPS